MNEVKQNNKILYLVIGVLTLIIATAGATFAYYTTSDSDTTTLTGNMATITFDVSVQKVTNIDDEVTATSTGKTRGLIPMSNSMIEYAVNPTVRTVNSTGSICEDDNGNAVCQIYRINVTNGGTASMLLDGYVTLSNGSGNPTDYPASYYNAGAINTNVVKNTTTMRWAQVFCTNDTSNLVSGCTTAGTTTTSATKSTNGVDKGITASTKWDTVLNNGTDAAAAINSAQIKINKSDIVTKATIAGNEYDVINTNYIRLSNHNAAATYDQSDDVTSALVYNEFLTAKDSTTNPTGGSGETYTDSQVFYIVVWLSETGTNQTAGAGVDGATANAANFFTGVVKFISAQGSEVTATFTDYTSVTPDTVD